MSLDPKQRTQELSTLLGDYHLAHHAELALPITGLATDSRTLKKGELFLAYPGESSDGRHYIADAISKEASAVLYEPSYQTTEHTTSVPLIPFPQLRDQIGALAARWFDYPTRHMDIYGITGTNGKTSCSHYLAQALALLKKRCAVLGTIGAGFPEDLVSSALTTPCALEVQSLAAELLHKGADSLAMEVSSHALIQGRVNSVSFKTAIFTNLTQDHLDYHRTMEAYGAAKAQLFYWSSLQNAIINVDDAFGLALFNQLKSQQGINVFAYGIASEHEIPAEQWVRADIIKEDKNGLQAKLYTPWGDGLLSIPLLGKFNLYNVLAVLSALLADKNLAVDLKKLLKITPLLKPVPGRMQCFGGGDKPLVIVDYAHTPDALKKVLLTLRDYHADQLWCVFGCGGDRDPAKRPIMGQIAAEYSDKVIVTNDNPRTEDPKKIVHHIMQGISSGKSVEVEYDRKQAIMETVKKAKAGDVVLVAGKGHEDYQILGEERVHFSDAEIVKQSLGLV